MISRFNFSIIISVVLFFSLLQTGASGIDSDVQMDQSHNNSMESSMAISSEDIWEDENLELSNSVSISGTAANLTVINSVITFTNNSQIHGFTIANGGHLTLIDSTVSFSGVDHAVFGLSSGSLVYNNATLSSENGDATHLEGQYNIFVIDSVFQDTGDDGLHIAQNDIPVIVKNSLFLNNSDDGFDLLEVQNATLINSRVEQVKGHAIKIIESGNITIEDVVVDGTGAVDSDDNRGMDIEDSNLVVVRNTTIMNFPSDGIKVQRTPFIGQNILIQNTNDEGIEFENTVSEYPVTLYNIDIINAKGGDALKIEFVEGHVILENINVINGGDDGIQITQGNTTVEMRNIYVENSNEDGLELDSSLWMTLNNVTSTNNVENGLKFKTIGDITIINSTFSDNGVKGINSANATTLLIKDSKFNTNLDGGLFIQNSNQFVLSNSKINQNRQTNVRATGLIIGGVQNFTLTDNSYSHNSGSGMRIDTSNGTIKQNSILSNELDGIAISGKSLIDIIGNEVIKNGQNGLSIVNESRGLIVNNTFSGNENYGVFVQASGAPIDLSQNYWDSDEGPIWQDVGEDGRDGVYGNVVITSYIDSNGNINPYEPPKEINFQTLFLVFVGVLLFLAIAGLIGYQIQLRRWKANTGPLALIYVSRIGLPVLEYNFMKGNMDPALISGFLSAVSSFGSEIYSREGPDAVEIKRIREIQSKENTIILYVVEKSMLALVVRNSNRAVRGSLKSFGDKFVTMVSEEKGEDMDEQVENLPVKQFEKLVDQIFDDFMV